MLTVALVKMTADAVTDQKATCSLHERHRQYDKF